MDNQGNCSVVLQSVSVCKMGISSFRLFLVNSGYPFPVTVQCISELSVSLSKLPVGCCCGNTVVNHIMYADDIVLLGPSAKAKRSAKDY